MANLIEASNVGSRPQGFWSLENPTSGISPLWVTTWYPILLVLLTVNPNPALAKSIFATLASASSTISAEASLETTTVVAPASMMSVMIAQSLF